MIRLVSWNIARRNLWASLEEHRPDVALLQEATEPPDEFRSRVLPASYEAWGTHGYPTRTFRTAVVQLTDRVELVDRPSVAIDQATDDSHWAVGRPGTVTAVDVKRDGETLFTAVSVYSPWERAGRDIIYGDASAHRILSDLSALMTNTKHRLVVAGDWNILRGYGEDGDPYWGARYQSLFDRALSLGLHCVGPEAPNGRSASPRPAEMPADSTTVPTFYHSRQSPTTASRQLDFVFASESLAGLVTTRALNDPEEWGGSDHCRVLIEVNV